MLHQTYLIVRRQRATFCDPNIASACLVPKQPQTAASLQELKNLIGPARSSRGSRYPLDGGLGLEKKAVKAQTGRWRGATRPPQAEVRKRHITATHGDFAQRVAQRWPRRPSCQALASVLQHRRPLLSACRQQLRQASTKHCRRPAQQPAAVS